MLLAFFFAHVEIEIEGAAGWAANLPTWRVDHHWLLDLAWGGRTMTGYHAWVFPFIFLFFHFPMAATCRISWRSECQALGAIMFFWIAEDFLWFALNPAFGIDRFDPAHAWWHKHWLLSAPVDYWIFAPTAFALFWLSLGTGRGVSPADKWSSLQSEAPKNPGRSTPARES